MSETVPHSRLASCVLFSRSHGVHFRLRLTRTTGRPFRSGCARPPRLLTMSQQKCVIAVDIHPRQTTLALTEISGRIAWQSVLSLPQDPTQAINRLTEAIQSAIHTHVGRIIEGIGVCLPGRTGPNAKDLIFIFAPNLRWPIVSLKARSSVPQACGCGWTTSPTPAHSPRYGPRAFLVKNASLFVISEPPF